MYYSMNFAPNESFRNYRYIGEVIRSFLSDPNAINSALENEIVRTLFPNSPNAFCISFFSGRSALYHLLQSLDLPTKSDVIVQSFTCTAVITPILHAGLTPIYVDINSSDFSANIESIKASLTPQTRVLILQHTFGITPLGRGEIIDICKTNDIFLIEDLAHGINPNQYSFPKELPLHATILSFGRSKLISSVFGSAIVTQNKNLSNTLVSRRNNLTYPSPIIRAKCLAYKFISPIVKLSFSLSPKIGSLFLYIFYKLHLFPKEIEDVEKMGQFSPKFDFKLPSELAPIILAEIPKLSTRIANIANISDIYRIGLGSKFVVADPTCEPILRFPIICESEAQKIKIIEAFKARGIHLGSWYDHVIAPISTDLFKSKYNENSCKTAENICTKIVNLPLQISESFARQINELLLSTISNNH